MKCPLLSIAFPNEMELQSPTVVACPKEECAWWDYELDQCSIVTLARQLHNTYSILDDIRDKMPHQRDYV